MKGSKWIYTIKAFVGRYGEELMSETVHATEVSKEIEVSVYKDRMKRGEISRIQVIQHVAPWKNETFYHHPHQTGRIKSS